MVEIREEVTTPGGNGVNAIVQDALESYGGPFSVSDTYMGPKPVVMCLLLDPHWYVNLIFI
jgi:hypothetical protein